jgi:NitT/TauT family transport system ATP-binding protein
VSLTNGRRLAPPGTTPAASAAPGLAAASARRGAGVHEPAPGQNGVVPGARGSGTTTAALQVSEVSKVYGRGEAALLALDKVSLSVAPGEFVCLIGASGCGKSTLLNLAAGLDTPTSGEVCAQGRVALMFQEPALFPWLTAGRNVEIALRARGVPKQDRGVRTAELLGAVHLAGFGSKRPHELSGGMRQRVALARALAQDADVLLMDEPFGALDAMTRDLLHDELERICAERTLTVLFVTHNVREAARLGDRVLLMSSRPGRVIEEYQVPRTGPRRIDSAQVAELAGRMTDRLREEMSRHGH